MKWALLLAALLVGSAGLGASIEGPIAWSASDARVSDPAALFPGSEKNLFEPTIAIDPTDPDNVLAFSLDFSIQNANPDAWSVIRGYRSTDGGASWSDTGVLDYDPATPLVWESGDPVVQFAADGTAYLSSLGYAPGGSRSVYVHRSDDGGATWDVIAEPVRAVEENGFCGGPDKEWLAVDPATEALYLSWTDFSEPCTAVDPVVGLDAVLQGVIRIGFSASHDGGTTWSEAQWLHSGWAFGQPDVGPDGTLYVAYWTSTDQPLQPCPSALAVVATRTQPFGAIGVASSRDGGATWTTHLQGACSFPELADAIKPGRNAGGNFQTAMTVDAMTGDAHVAYPTLVGQRYTIMVITSRDGGVTWSAPTDATPDTIAHASLPAIAAENGLVGIAYQEGRLDGSGDTMFVASTDRGATWSAKQLLSSAPSQLGRLPDAGPERDPHTGDYWHIDVAGGRIAAIWADARLTDPVEIYARVGTITT